MVSNAGIVWGKGSHDATGGPRACTRIGWCAAEIGRQVRSRRSMGMSQWGQRDRCRGPRQPLLVAQIQKIAAQLLVVHLAGALPAPARQPAHCPHIRLDGPFREPPQLHLFDHPLPQIPRRFFLRYHGLSPRLRTGLIARPLPATMTPVNRYDECVIRQLPRSGLVQQLRD